MSETQTSKGTQRLVSLDAYRGAIMISLISLGFGFSVFEGHPYLNFLAYHTEHVAWEGCVYWDLIQPAFMFMVGVAMPFSYAKRRSLGDSHNRIFLHVIKRSIMLILIAAFFTSIHVGHPTLTFINVLPQIAIGYFLTFFVLNLSFTTQGITAFAILFVYTLVWILYPGNGAGGPWAMGNQNIGSDFDMWLMGKHYSGYYVGLNAIPSTANIIAGAMCGKLLADGRSHKEIIKILAISAFALMLFGFLLSFFIPMIKRIWTASFAIYSTGWTILILLLFYWVVEVLDYRRWTFVLLVVGMNSIAAYIMFQLFTGWIRNAVYVFAQTPIEALGQYGKLLHVWLLLAVEWYILYFFYKRKIFFKV